MFRFHSHNTYICIIVVLVKEAKLLASIQPMGNKKRNVSLPSHNTYICFIVVLVKEAKLLASIQPMGNKKRNVSLPFPQHICMYYCCVSKRSETSRFHTDNGQQEAKCFASNPTTHIYSYFIISIKVVVPRAKRKSRIRARKAAGNRNSCMYNIR